MARKHKIIIGPPRAESEGLVVKLDKDPMWKELDIVEIPPIVNSLEVRRIDIKKDPLKPNKRVYYLMPVPK